MTGQVQSILIGTSGLTLALTGALLLSSRTIPAARVPAVRRLALLAVTVHAAHFAEEYLTGFHLRFPALLGLAPWPATFFVIFNASWMAIWLVCAASLGRFPHGAAFPLWFLGIAAAANGVAHPLLALLVGGYFPGLWTSPLAGAAGIALLWALAARSGSPASPPGPGR